MNYSLENFPWATFGRKEEPRDFLKKCNEQRGFTNHFTYRPLISLILTGDSKNEKHCVETLESLRDQSYPFWEAVVISNSKEMIQVVESLNETRISMFSGWRKTHFGCKIAGQTATASNSQKVLDVTLRPRLRTFCSFSLFRRGRQFFASKAVSRQPLVTQDGREAEQRNLGVERTRGEWVGFLSMGEVLSPVALYYFLLELQRGPFGLVYSNQASVNTEVTEVVSFFSKPAFSWFNLLHYNYISRFWLVDRKRFNALGGFSPLAGAHHEHDFLLRLSESGAPIGHLSQFLLYERQRPSLEHQACELQKTLVEAHLNRIGMKAKVHLSNGSLRVIPELLSDSLVTAIICFRDRAEMTLDSVRALLRQRGRVSLEVILVNNQSSPMELRKIELGISKLPIPVRLLHFDSPFNFARMNNLAVKEARGSFLLLLNNDVVMSDEQTIDEMVAWAQLPWVGTVGIRLSYPDGRIQYGGFKGVFGGRLRLARITHVREESGLPYVNKEVFGNTFAFCLLKRETYQTIGGLRELELSNGFGDVAFNFEALRRNLKHVYLGHLSGIHVESASRGSSYEYGEECEVEKEFPDILQRMLRSDLGYDRVPAKELSLSHYVRDEILPRLMNISSLRHLRTVVERLSERAFQK